MQASQVACTSNIWWLIYWEAWNTNQQVQSHKHLDEKGEEKGKTKTVRVDYLLWKDKI